MAWTFFLPSLLSAYLRKVRALRLRNCEFQLDRNKMPKIKLLFFFTLFFPAIAAGQGAVIPPGVAPNTVNGVTRRLSKPFFADSSGNANYAMTPGTYTVSVTSAGFSGYSYQISVFSCVPGTCITTGGNNAFTGNNTHTGNQTFSGGSPWFDVTGPNFGALCNGSTNDTAAIQAALNAASSVAGTVFVPPGKTCNVSTALVLDGFSGVTVRGGWGVAPQAGNVQSTLNFTGGCSSAACLSMRSVGSINFYNIQLNFSGATAGPMVDLSRRGLGGDSAFVGFHGVTFRGPGLTVGPIVLDQNTDIVAFDQFTTFSNASVFVEGPATNASGSGFSDLTTFSDVEMTGWGTSAIENASIDWNFTRIIAESNNASSCVPFLQYINGYTNMQTLSITNSLFNPGANSCANSYSLITIPAASANLGGFTFSGNLVIPNSGSTTGTMISVGNGQSITASNNIIQNVVTGFAFGAGNLVSLGPNIYSGVTNVFSGIPASGQITNSAGGVTAYPGLTPGAGIAVAALPSAASNPGMMVYVTDSTAIVAEGQTCAGSSTNKALAFSNGTSWKCF
jgi:hypothetical protein